MNSTFIEEAMSSLKKNADAAQPTNWREAALKALSQISSSSHAAEAFGADYILDEIATFGSLDLADHAIPAHERLMQIGGLVAPTVAEHIDPIELLDLLCAKQKAYGHGNILAYGISGVEVRLSDKLARLSNLASNDYDPEDETVADTLIDILGYCVIGKMLVDGTFGLDLPDENAPNLSLVPNDMTVVCGMDVTLYGDSQHPQVLRQIDADRHGSMRVAGDGIVEFNIRIPSSLVEAHLRGDMNSPTLGEIMLSIVTDEHLVDFEYVGDWEITVY